MSSRQSHFEGKYKNCIVKNERGNMAILTSVQCLPRGVKMKNLNQHLILHGTISNEIRTAGIPLTALLNSEQLTDLRLDRRIILPLN